MVPDIKYFLVEISISILEDLVGCGRRTTNTYLRKIYRDKQWHLQCTIKLHNLHQTIYTSHDINFALKPNFCSNVLSTFGFQLHIIIIVVNHLQGNKMGVRYMCWVYMKPVMRLWSYYLTFIWPSFLSNTEYCMCIYILCTIIAVRFFCIRLDENKEYLLQQRTGHPFSCITDQCGCNSSTVSRKLYKWFTWRAWISVWINTNNRRPAKVTGARMDERTVPTDNKEK